MPAALLADLGLGGLTGLFLGALGGGGSILTVPALVYLLGEPVRAAATDSLVIVGATALAAAVGHARAGRVRWATGLSVGAAGVLASYAGTAANRAVDPDVLLLAFAGLVAVAAVAMLARRHAPAATGGDVTPAARPAARAARIVAAGFAVGFLTGFLGVGGGFVIVPALVMALGYGMPEAVGTSLLIIAINSAAGLAARAGHGGFHWTVILPFAGAAVAASLASQQVAGRLPARTLVRAFACLLIAVAAYGVTRATVGLTA